MYWDTQEQPLDDQFSYWGDVVCQAFTPLEPARTRRHRERSSHGDGMRGWVRASALGSTNTAEIGSVTQRLTHGRDEVRRTPAEQVFVNLQLQGSCFVEQDGRRCVVRPGMIGLVDTTRPFTQEYEESDAGREWRVLSFRVPRQQLLAMLPADAPVKGVAIDARSGPGHVAASMMRSLWDARDQLDGAARSAMDRSYGEVLATAISGAFPRAADGDRSSYRSALLTAVHQHVADRLPCGPVTAAEAAARVGISVRSLHNLYSSTGTTFAASVRDLRLRECARELADPLSNRSIADIAASWGFADGAHLSRTFRQRHGRSPQEYRAQQRATDRAPTSDLPASMS